MEPMIMVEWSASEWTGSSGFFSKQWEDLELATRVPESCSSSEGLQDSSLQWVELWEF